MIRRESHSSAFDLTPMIDVVLLLIIFFLVSAQISRSIRQPVDLPNQPGAEARELSGEGAIVVDLLRGGELRVDGETVDLDTFMAMVKSSDSPEGVVLIRPEHDTRAEHLNRLTRRLAEDGTASYRIATDPVGRGG